MSLTDYEKYHLYDYVYTRVFYRGHCKHNNSGTVRFYPNTDAGFSANITQSDSNDFICDSSDNSKLIFKKKGLYVISFIDSHKASRSFTLKVEKSNNTHDEVQYNTTVNKWLPFPYTTIMESDVDTTLKISANNGTQFDGLIYSSISIYKIAN